MLPREVVISLSLEIFRSSLDMVLGNLLSVSPTEWGSWTVMTPRGSCQSQLFCDSVVRYLYLVSTIFFLSCNEGEFMPLVCYNSISESCITF